MLETVEEELSHGVVVEEAPEVVELEDSEAKVAEVLVSLDVQVEGVSEDTIEVVQGVEVDVSEVTEDSEVVVSLVGAIELSDDVEVSKVEQGEVSDSSRVLFAQNGIKHRPRRTITQQIPRKH